MHVHEGIYTIPLFNSYVIFRNSQVSILCFDVMIWKHFAHYWSFVCETTYDGGFIQKGSGMQSFDVFYLDNKIELLIKHSICQWYKMLWSPYYGSAEGLLRVMKNYPDNLRMEAYVIRMTE